MNKADLIIIGAGPGGYETALRASAQGISTILIEKGLVGGTCLNEGCIPTKCFCRSAEIMEDIAVAESLGIRTGTATPDMKLIVSRKDKTVSGLRDNVKAMLERGGVNLINGTASFVDAHTLRVSRSLTQADTEGDLLYQAKHIIIATGSLTRPMAIPGTDLPGVVTSKELLDVEQIPPRLCIIGGGVIGMEFASIFHALGSQVTVLEFCKEILPNFDNDIAKRLRMTLKAKGLPVVTQANVTGIHAEADGSLTVAYRHKDATDQTVGADLVLTAVGRIPNLATLELERAGIAYTGKGITVNGNMQTNVPHIYAIGDVNGLCQLAHAASFQGERALNHIMQKADSLQLDIMPAAVFTCPEMASVGLTEESAKKLGLEYRVGKSFFRANGKAQAMGATDGMVKLIADTDGGIVGCHVLGAHAADLVQEITALIHFGATVRDVAGIVHTHPTLAEAILDAARQLL